MPSRSPPPPLKKRLIIGQRYDKSPKQSNPQKAKRKRATPVVKPNKKQQKNTNKHCKNQQSPEQNKYSRMTFSSRNCLSSSLGPKPPLQSHGTSPASSAVFNCCTTSGGSVAAIWFALFKRPRFWPKQHNLCQQNFGLIKLFQKQHPQRQT